MRQDAVSKPSSSRNSSPAANSVDARESMPAALDTPVTLGIWRLVRRLHRGHWSELYAAQPADSVGNPRCDYVVKVVRRTAHEDPEAAHQMRVEATVAGSAKHRHLIPVLDGQITGPKPYLVMPRIEAQTLAESLAGGPRPVPVALWWARQCAQALAALHAAGWIHGDLKPENLLVDSRGHVTLIDLGMAQRIGTPRELLGTVGAFRGTPKYAAPEVVNGAFEAVSAAADIFSLGVVLGELLGEEVPASESLRQTLGAMLSDSPRERPSAQQLAEALLQLEIETLHLHIRPEDDVFGRRAA